MRWVDFLGWEKDEEALARAPLVLIMIQTIP